MNKVVLIGRLTRDPELRYTSSNIPSARFSLAVDRPFTSQSGERETDFINIVVWRKQAENVKKYITKGSLVAVEGRIQTGSYEKDGQRVYTTDVVVEEQDFAESKAAASSYTGGYQQQGGYANAPEPQVAPAPTSRPAPSEAVSDGFMTIPEGIEEELPFI